MIAATLLALVSTTLAFPIKHLPRDTPQPSCEALPWWKEYSDLGVNSFPDPKYITTANATVKGWYNVNIVADRVNWWNLTDYGESLTDRFSHLGLNCYGRPLPVTINVFANEIFVTLPQPRENNTFSPCFTWNLFATTLTNPKNTTQITYQWLNSRPNENRTYETGFDVVQVNGFVPYEVAWKWNGRDLIAVPQKDPLHNFGPLTGNRKNDLLSNNGTVPELPIAQWSLLYACARSYAGWNLRSATLDQAKFAHHIASSLAIRLSNLDSNFRTTETDGLKIQAIQLSNSLSQNYNITGNATNFPLEVSRWSVATLQQRLKESLTPAMNLANRVKQGLGPNVVDQVRANSLQDMSSLVSASADGNQFVLDQTMQQVSQYQTSVNSLDAQNIQFGQDLDAANQRYSNGVAKFRTKETAKSVWSFLKGMGQIAAGIATNNIGGFLSGCGDIFSASVNLNQMLEDFEKLRQLQDTLRGFFGNDSIALPSTDADLKDFVQRATTANPNDPIFSQKMHDNLLALSSFDRSTADALSVKFDSIRSYIDDLMKFSVDNNIDGTQQVTVAIKKFTVSGKAALTAKIGLADAKATFARALYQIITARRQAKYMDDQLQTMKQTAIGQRFTYLRLTTPSIISVQGQLVDALGSVCNAYYYTEAEECTTISDNNLQAFSIQNFPTFVDSLVGLVNRLADARPLERQAYNLDTSPLTLNIQKYPDVIESFKTSSTVTIPSSVFENMPFFHDLSAVCMKAASVELVGAKAKEQGTQAKVMVKSLANPANQRPKGGKKMLQFKTPVVNVASSYVIGGRRSASGAPIWSMDGSLYDDQSNFCRSVFQDMMLTLPSTDGIDLSGVTAIKIYLSGTALVGNGKITIPNKDYEPAQFW